MRTVLFIARQEIRQILRGKMQWILIGSIWGLVALSAWSGGIRHASLSSTHEAVHAFEKKAWEDQPDRHPHRAAHFGQFAFRPPGILEVIESGVMPFTGSAIYLEPHVRNEPVLAPSRSLPPSTRMGYFQINTVFSLFIPLILIFMVVPRLPYESGSGILRILESQGIFPREILLGKSLGAWGVACLVFILPLLVLGSTVLLATSPGTYLHFVFYVLQTAVYYLLWCLAFVTVSSYFRTESAAIGAALGIFIVQSLVIPRIVPTVAETLLPEMGTGQFKQRLYAELAKSPNGHRPGGPEFDLFKKQLMEKHGVAKLEDLPFNYEGLVMQKAEEHSTRVFQAAFEEQWGLFARQERLAITLAFFSPTAIQRILSMHFTRSHSSDQRHFELAVEGHRNGMNRDLNTLLTSLPYQDRKTKKLPAATWAGIPTFKMEGMPFKHSLSYAMPALLILVFQTAWAVLFLLRRRSLCA